MLDDENEEVSVLRLQAKVGVKGKEAPLDDDSEMIWSLRVQARSSLMTMLRQYTCSVYKFRVQKKWQRNASS